MAGSQFSVSQQESSAKTAILENALDIKVNKDQMIALFNGHGNYHYIFLKLRLEVFVFIWYNKTLQ